MARGWKIANGSNIMANFNYTVKDIYNMFILDGGKTHYADLPRQVHIKKKTYPPCNTQWGQSYFPLFLIWLFITMFSLPLRFLEKILFTFRIMSSKRAGFEATSRPARVSWLRCFCRSPPNEAPNEECWLESNEAKIPAGAVIHLTSVTHSFGITMVILHCRELSICNYPISGWLKSHERTISYIFQKGWAAVTLLVCALLQLPSLNYA